MADIMDFPDTVEEFMEQYKVTDTKRVYSNGTEYVPIFRMKQWLEHIRVPPVAHGSWIEKPFLMGHHDFAVSAEITSVCHTEYIAIALPAAREWTVKTDA